MILLTEATRREIIRRSKDDSANRYDRRMTVDDTRININRVGVLELVAQSPHLDIYFDINKYRSSVRILNVVPDLQKEFRTGRYDLSVYQDIRKLVEKVVNKALDHNDFQVDCTCPDFRYRFSYVATLGNYKLGKPETRPAKKTNPSSSGSVCKHLARVLNIPSKWKNLVITAVIRSIDYDNSIVTGL